MIYVHLRGGNFIIERYLINDLWCRSRSTVFSCSSTMEGMPLLFYIVIDGIVVLLHWI